MKEQKITVEPFEMLDILQCNGKVCANCHGYMFICGHIKADREKEYLELLTKETWVSVKTFDENGGSKVLFSGIITEGSIDVDNGLKTLSITIKTGSFLMDLEEHTRTFQNGGTSYDKVMDILMTSYPSGSYLMAECQGKSIGRFLCQYRETDWKFAKRLGSYFGTSIYPNYIGTGVKVYCGLPYGKYQGNIESTEYSMNQSLKGISYCLRTREIYNIGDTVYFLGHNCHITSRETVYDSAELCHIYELTENGNAQLDAVYNDRLTGVSLMATVTGVKTTNVTVSIDEDENKASCGSKWFPYATVYSSADGTGWYCMPEEKDRVRVYFPSNRECEAYVIHSTHVDSTNIEERVNPDYKSFMNKQGKELLFKPDSILMTNNNGMSVELSDKEGIFIVSDKKVSIQSDQEIEITSLNERVDIAAREEISLKQGDTKLVLSDKLTMRGAKIRLN